MTQDEIIRMARDGIQSYLSNGGLFNPKEMNHDKVRELIMLCRDALDLVASHERDACAKVCDDIGDSDNGYGCAAAIRARGNNAS